MWFTSFLSSNQNHAIWKEYNFQTMLMSELSSVFLQALIQFQQIPPSPASEP